MEKANKTINVKNTTKIELMRAKLYERETFDDVILRLIAMYQATEPQ